MTSESPRHDPWDIEVEQALLGSLLADNRHIDTAAAMLVPEQFYDPLHARVYAAIVQRIAGDVTTPLTLHAVMKADPGIIATGGQAYLDALRAAAPSIPHIRDFCNILADLSCRRQLIGVGEEIVAAAYDAPHEVTSRVIASKATDALLALTGTAGAAERTVSLASVAMGRLHVAERRLKGEAVPCLSTGLAKMDRAMGGLQPGDHMVIAARSAMGKTALAAGIGRGVAQSGAPVFIVSADMTKERWGERVLCDIDHLRESGVDPIHYGRFRGRMSEAALERLAIAQGHMAGWACDICDEGDITVSRIRAKVRAMANRYKGQQGLLVVDFLQKIAVDSDRRDRRRDEDITAVTYAIGDIVKDVGWSAVSLAQMKNKDTDGKGKLREDPPNESDIRESGGILMAADIVIAPHRRAFFVERREPPGRDMHPEPPAEWHDWNSELAACRDEMQIIGFKNRDDSISKLNMTLWCDMGSNAIRDEKPGRGAAGLVPDEELRF